MTPTGESSATTPPADVGAGGPSLGAPGPRRPPRLGLGQLFLLWLLAVVILTLALAVGLVVWQEHDFLQRDLELRARSLARVLAVAAREGWVERVPLASVPEIRAAEVRDGGNVLWAYGRSVPMDTARHAGLLAISEPATATGSTGIHVSMQLSTARIRAHLLASGARLVGGLTAALAIALVLGAVLVDRVTRPILQLAAGMRKFHPEGATPELIASPGAREVAELAATFRDMAVRLTEQRRSLAASEARFRDLFMISPTPALELSDDLHVVRSNPAAEPFLGPAAGESVAVRLNDCVTPAVTTDELAAGAGAGAELVLDRRWQLPGGDAADVELHLRPLIAAGVSWLLTVHDVTDRVRRLGERWRRTFDAMTDGVAVVGLDGGVQIANRALGELVPDLAEVLGSRPDGEEPAQWETASSGRRLRLTVSRPGEGGSRILVVRDVTDEVRAEERLRQAQKLEAVATLASGVAHDFNNLLAGVLLHVRVLEREPDLEAVRAIRELAEEGAEVVRELLVYARRESAPRSPLDLAKLVSAQEALLGHLLPEEVRLEVTVPVEPIPVLASAGELRRVLLNLVVNARDAMPAAGGTIQVVVSTEDSTAILEVLDDGTGVPPEQLARVFEPFVSLRRGGSGTGLGLAVVQAVAHEHGGGVEATARAGGGSRFVVRLPLRSDLELATAEMAEAVPVAGNERLLVVEDEPAVAERLLAELAAVGYDVRHARTLADATRLLADWHPEGLVVDLFLPDGLGTDLAVQAAADGAPRPTLVVTGTRDEALAHLPDDLPRVAVVEKPFAVERLLLELRRLLR